MFRKPFLYNRAYVYTWLLVPAVVLLSGYWLLSVLSADTVTVVAVHEDMFEPDSLTISQGETVKFVNKSGREAWPASNAHPSHTAYSAFDPRKPVPPGKSWSFTFDRIGVWKFHDHLNPLASGKITVLSEAGKSSRESCADNKTPRCWEEMVLSTLETDGVTAAFELVSVLSETEPSFTNDCHDYAHLIGEHAYELFVNDTNFELTPATALCGYGFYHGFMETLLHTSGNIEEAREFCTYADKKLEGQAAAAATACYHGVGHGAVDGGDPRDWGDVDAMLEPGFEFCNIFAETERERYLCATGAFNAVEILSREPRYELTEMREDPLTVCNRQPIERQEACYSNMIPAVLGLTGGDLVAANAYYNERMLHPNEPTIDNFSTNDLLTIGLFFEHIRMGRGEPTMEAEGIADCRALPTEDHLPCVAGLGGGFVKYGTAGQGFYEALDFCGSDRLRPEEADACYEYILPRAQNSITESELRSVCAGIENESYRTYCPLAS